MSVFSGPVTSSIYAVVVSESVCESVCVHSSDSHSDVRSAAVQTLMHIAPKGDQKVVAVVSSRLVPDQTSDIR